MVDQQKFIQIFKASPIPVSIVKADDPQFTCVQVNDAYLTMTQSVEEDLLGNPLFKTFPASSEEKKSTVIDHLRSSFQKVMATKEPDELHGIRYDRVLKDGLYKQAYWKVINTPVMDETGEVEFIVNSATNITEQVLSEQENKLMLNNTEDSFILINREMNILNFNALFARKYRNIFGINIQKGDSILEYTRLERRRVVNEIYERVFRGETIESESPFETLGGDTKFFNIKYKPALDEEGNIIGSFTSLLEKTDEHIAKLQLEKNEARFRALVENGSDILFILHPDGNLKYVSPAIKKVIGFTPEKALKMNWVSYIHPDDIDTIKSEIKNCLEKPDKPLEVPPVRLKNKDGKWLWFEGTITNMLRNTAVEGIAGNFREITEWFEAEKKINEAKKQYKTLIQTIDGIVWEADAETFIFNYVSPQAERLLGYTPDEWVGTPGFWRGKIHPDDRQDAIEFCKNQTQKGKNHSFEYRIKKASGEYIWVKDVVTVVEKSGVPNSLRGLIIDITEAKEAHIERKKAEEKYRNVVEYSTNMFYQHDTEGILTYVSPQSKDFLGYTADEAIRNWTEFITDHPKNKEGINITRKTIETGKIQPPYELQLRKADGSLIWVEVNEAPLKKDGQVIEIVGSLTDITARKLYEEQLQESLERYNYVSKATRDAIYDWKIKKDHLHWGEGYKTLFGHDYGEDKYPLKKWAGLVHPDDLADTEKSLKQALNDKNVNNWNAEYRFGKKDGGYAYVLESGFILRDEKKEAQRMIGSIRDVSERIHREKKLRELSLVASKTTDIVIITDADGLTTWVNPAFEKLTGYTLKEIAGEKPGDILQGPQTDPDTVQKLSLAIKARNSVEATILNYDKQGHSYWLEITIDPIFDEEGNCTHFIAIEKDVTEKIEKENELRESLERYDIVSKATSDTIWDLDLETDSMLYNKNIYNMFGYEKTEVQNLASWWRDKIHPDDIEAVDLSLAEVLKNNKERFQMEYRFKTANDSYKHIFDRAFVITGENGKAVRMIGAMQDVSQEVEEEERLKLLESVITNSGESIVILEAEPTDMPGRKILYVNEAFSKLTGYNKEEVLGQSLHFLNGPNTDRDKTYKLRNAMNRYEPVEVELINYKKSGEEFWINISMVPVTDKNENYTHWVVIGRDITERKMYEKEIKSSLAEKETLLAEIHHRVKNNLAVISGMMQLQAYESESNEELQTQLYDSVTRIRTMATVHELLYQTNSFSHIDFSQSITHLAKNISETLESNANVNLNIECDSVQLNINQAIPASLIVNEVITNAYKHAFKEKNSDGLISIQLRQRTNFVDLTITDNGVGVPGTFDKNDITTMGLKLIHVLANQINASYDYGSAAVGTMFKITFEKNISKGSGNANL